MSLDAGQIGVRPGAVGRGENKLGVWLGVWVKLFGVSGKVLYQDKTGSTDLGIHQDWELVSIIQSPFHPNVTTACVSKSFKINDQPPKWMV